MNKIKNIFAATLLLTSAALISSCSNDDDITYTTDMGTVSYLASSNSESTQITGDDTGLCYLLNENALKYTKTDSVGQRIIFTYSVEEDKKRDDLTQVVKKNIRIHDLYKVLTKNMDTLSIDQKDDFGKDIIYINWMYASESHLNIQFTIGRDNPTIAHRISLVGLEGSKPDENGVLNLDLRHNMFKDTPYIKAVGYVSYTLESIPGFKEGTLKKLVISCQNSDKETKKYEISLKKEDNNGKAARNVAVDIKNIF